MRWSSRLFLAIAVLLAAAPPFLATRLAQRTPPPDAASASERAGLTLGEGRGRDVVVTSLRSGGPADHGGIAVGDDLQRIAGQRVTGVAMARRIINDPARCDMEIDLRREGAAHVARISQCGKTVG